MAQSAPESIAGGIGRRTCREELDSIFLRHRARISSALIFAASLARWLRGRLGRLAGVLGETAAAVTLGARARGARAWQTSGLALALAREARVQAKTAPPAQRRAGAPREGAESLARNFVTLLSEKSESLRGAGQGKSTSS